MPEPIDVKKVFDMRPTTLVKTASSTVKGLLVILAIAGLGWAVYAGIIKPVIKPIPTTTQQAAQIDNKNYYLQPHFGGCARLIMQEKK